MAADGAVARCGGGRDARGGGGVGRVPAARGCPSAGGLLAALMRSSQEISCLGVFGCCRGQRLNKSGAVAVGVGEHGDSAASTTLVTTSVPLSAPGPPLLCRTRLRRLAGRAWAVARPR